MADIVDRLTLRSDPDSRDAVTEIERLRKDRQHFVEALTPNIDTKVKHIAQYKFTISEVLDNGIEVDREVYVPWTTVKQIMRGIRRHAELLGEKGV